MLRKRKEARTCHDCGLEAFEDCEARKGHIPADETLLPCSCCVRNPKKTKAGWIADFYASTSWRADFYSETWTRDSDKSAIIEDPTPHERTLLETLHLIVAEQTQKSALCFHGPWAKGR